MREKGIISQAEYDSAIRDLSETSGARAPDGGTVVMGKWATPLYGFAEADNIYDTSSFTSVYDWFDVTSSWTPRLRSELAPSTRTSTPSTSTGPMPPTGVAPV
jgi:hypothetical protein